MTENPKLADMSKQELINKIVSLEMNLTSNASTKRSVSPPVVSPSRISDAIQYKRVKTGKSPRIFDSSKYWWRPIALKVAYFGWNYYGLASQHSDVDGCIAETNPTIESKLFAALWKCKLIPQENGTPGTLFNYSRCGRTDRGVSAICQILGMRLRSNLPNPNTMENQPDTMYHSKSKQSLRELCYVDLINRQLPPDIRVLAWSPVPEKFDARFNCISREYRYYFSSQGLDLQKMQQSCQLLIGQHDFRNFCKIDPSKPEMTYERRILECEIIPMKPPCTVSDQTTSWFALRLKGTAFLWHQVRCIMAILFLIGQGHESSDIITQLLDIKQVSSRPAYDIAHEAPLVLHSCEFTKDVKFQWSNHVELDEMSDDYLNKLLKHVQEIRDRRYIDFLVIDSLYSQLRHSSQPSNEEADIAHIDKKQIVLGGGSVRSVKRYTPLLVKKRCKSVEDRRSEALNNHNDR